MCVFFQHTSRQAVVTTLKYSEYWTVNDVPLPLKEIKKRRSWDGTAFQRIC